MANTYTQLYTQIIFSPLGRQNLIHNKIKNEIYKYIVGIIKKKNQKPMIINGMPDHVHIFLGFSPDIAISDLVRDIKSNSTNFINNNKLIALWNLVKRVLSDVLVKLRKNLSLHSKVGYVDTVKNNYLRGLK